MVAGRRGLVTAGKLNGDVVEERRNYVSFYVDILLECRNRLTKTNPT